MWIVLLMEETEYQDKTTDLPKVNDILAASHRQVL